MPTVVVWGLTAEATPAKPKKGAYGGQSDMTVGRRAQVGISQHCHNKVYKFSARFPINPSLATELCFTRREERYVY
jgi:hypothetical protein